MGEAVMTRIVFILALGAAVSASAQIPVNEAGVEEKLGQKVALQAVLVDEEGNEVPCGSPKLISLRLGATPPVKMIDGCPGASRESAFGSRSGSVRLLSSGSLGRSSHLKVATVRQRRTIHTDGVVRQRGIRKRASRPRWASA